VDAMTGRIARITGLCLAIVALAAAVEQVTQVGSNALRRIGLIGPADTRTDDPKSCFQPRLTYPESVMLGQWDQMDLRLTGRNDCRDTLAVHVAFKGREDRLRIEPPFSDASCTQVDDPSCWEQKTLERGEVDWQVTPPTLTPLLVPLGERVRVDVNWIIYNAETRVQVRADTARIWLQDDPAAAGQPGNLARR